MDVVFLSHHHVLRSVVDGDHEVMCVVDDHEAMYVDDDHGVMCVGDGHETMYVDDDPCRTLMMTHVHVYVAHGTFLSLMELLLTCSAP